MATMRPLDSAAEASSCKQASDRCRSRPAVEATGRLTNASQSVAEDVRERMDHAARAADVYHVAVSEAGAIDEVATRALRSTAAEPQARPT